MAGEEERIVASVEIPDEFLDPITYTVMLDPVEMPTSHTVIDRKTILRHLLTGIKLLLYSITNRI